MILVDFNWVLYKSSFFWANDCSWSSCLLKPLIALIPTMVSLLVLARSSCLFWTFVNKGMLISIIVKTITSKIMIVSKKVKDNLNEILAAMKKAPKTIIGDLNNNLKAKLSPFWIWLMSFVNLTISDEGDNLW